MKAQNIIHTNHININDNKINTYSNLIKITEYISWLELRIQPKSDLTLKLNNPHNNYLHFIYNLKDAVNLLPISTRKQKKLNQFQSAIMHDRKGDDTFLQLKANKDYEVCIVQLTKYNDKKEVNNLFMQFEKVFSGLNDDDYFIHTGLPNLQISEYVRMIREMSKEKLQDKLMAFGYINILLSLKLKQYLQFANDPSPTSVLSTVEIERIQKISASIQDNPEMNYTIDDLCRDSGLSAAKLQIGFKEMHGKTICNYVTHLRLEKAEAMLKTTDMNVSQIVYALGWSSRSYFCKIFKQKYKCSPKNYQSLLVVPV